MCYLQESLFSKGLLKYLRKTVGTLFWCPVFGFGVEEGKNGLTEHTAGALA